MMINKQNYKEIIILPEPSTVPTMEVIEMKVNGVKKKKSVVVAMLSFMLLLVGSNGIVYAATGETWIEKVIQYTYNIGQNTVLVEYGTKDGLSYFEASMTENEDGGYTEYKDGRTYFVFGDSRTDITDVIANDNYYTYEYTDDQNVYHVIVAGEGTFVETDNGKEFYSLWEETFYFPNGKAGSTAHIASDEPFWLKKAHENMKPFRRE